MRNRILKVVGILLVALFGPLFIILFMWLSNQNPAGGGFGGVFSFGEHTDKRFKGKWYYQFFSFIVHKKDESFLANMIRFLVFDLPFNIIIYSILVAISVVWTLTVFRLLFRIDLAPFFVTLLFSR